MILGPTSTDVFATSSVQARADETGNVSRLIRLLMVGGTEALRGVFDRFYPAGELKAFLNSNRPTLLALMKRRTLSPVQWKKLFPPLSTPDSSTFDISLLVLLLRNICGLRCPPNGWNTMPSPDDITLEADIARIKHMRNLLLHMVPMDVSYRDFDTQWKKMIAVLERLGLKQAEIDRLTVEPWGGDESYREAFLDWYKCEMEIKTQLREISNTLQDMVTGTVLDSVPDPNQRISTIQGR